MVAAAWAKGIARASSYSIAVPTASFVLEIYPADVFKGEGRWWDARRFDSQQGWAISPGRCDRQQIICSSVFEFSLFQCNTKSIWISKFKNHNATVIRNTKKSLFRQSPILAVRRKHKERGGRCKGIWASPSHDLRWRCPWCNCYRRRKWLRWHEFKSWTKLIAFHIALVPLGKVWIQLFSLQLWVNSRTD